MDKGKADTHDVLETELLLEKTGAEHRDSFGLHVFESFRVSCRILLVLSINVIVP
jgi:hypothetical protein